MYMYVVQEIYLWADRQIDWQTDTVITLLRSAIGGGIINTVIIRNWRRPLFSVSQHSAELIERLTTGNARELGGRGRLWLRYWSRGTGVEQRRCRSSSILWRNRYQQLQCIHIVRALEHVATKRMDERPRALRGTWPEGQAPRTSQYAWPQLLGRRLSTLWWLASRYRHHQ